MTMQTDVKSTHLSAAGSVYASRARLKGFTVGPPVNVLVTFEFRDGGATGPILAQFDIPANTNPNSFFVSIPGEGILFQTNIYMTISAGAFATGGVTAFYG